MEFFPGAFETEWERRRAMLVHEMQLGRIDSYDWDEPKRGGVARPLDEGARGVGQPRQSCEGVGSTDRSMRTRFAALARGSQPAVVKLASYGGGARAGAMMSYASRGGELAVENERGERVLGKGALAEQRAEWEHLLDNRAASRDLAVFQVAIDAASLRQDFDQDDQLRHILVSGFGDRRFVYSARERNPGEIQVNGVVVLRSGQGERLTGDRKAAEIVQQRHHDSEAGRDVDARFRFHGYPGATVYAPPGLREKRPDIRFDADLTDSPIAAWAEEIDYAVMWGNRITKEVVFFHRESGTAIFTDLIQQFPHGWFRGWRALVARLDLMTAAEPSVPRKFRVAFTDRYAARQSLRHILAWPTEKLIVAHGPPITNGGQAFLRRAFRWLAK